MSIHIQIFFHHECEGYKNFLNDALHTTEKNSRLYTHLQFSTSRRFAILQIIRFSTTLRMAWYILQISHCLHIQCFLKLKVDFCKYYVDCQKIVSYSNVILYALLDYCYIFADTITGFCQLLYPGLSVGFCYAR